MEWVILIFLIPLIVVPVVLLAGFAGCSFQPGAISPPDSSPPAPSNLVAKAISSSEIELSWTDNATNTTAYKIQRSENGGQPVVPSTPPPAPGTMPLQWTDSGLNPATPYEYQVFAVVVDQTSDGSNKAPATTFAIAYDIPLTTDEAGFENSTLVQRIDAAHITTAAAKVRLTLRGSSAADLAINKVTISQAAASGRQWDSAADLTEVRFGGASGVTIPAGNFKVSDDTNYNLVLGTDLTIAFDISATAGAARNVQVVGPTLYSKKNTAEAAMQSRSANYSPHFNSVYIVEKIEVIP